MAPTQVSRYEAGRATPRRGTLARMAEALAVRYQWLTAGTGRMDEYANETRTSMTFTIDGALTDRLHNYAASKGLTLSTALADILDFALSVYEKPVPAEDQTENTAVAAMRLKAIAGHVKIVPPGAVIFDIPLIPVDPPFPEKKD